MKLLTRIFLLSLFPFGMLATATAEQKLFPFPADFTGGKVFLRNANSFPDLYFAKFDTANLPIEALFMNCELVRITLGQRKNPVTEIGGCEAFDDRGNKLIVVQVDKTKPVYNFYLDLNAPSPAGVASGAAAH